MDGLAIKLDFDDIENVEVNSSMLINSGCEDVNYYYNNNTKEDMDTSSCNVGSSPDGMFSPRKELKFSSKIYNDSPPYKSKMYSDSPPYKRIRALKLFDSPATPKTLLQKCAADSTSTTKSRFRPCENDKKLSTFSQSKECNTSFDSTNSKSSVNTSKNSSNVPVANINPFTPNNMTVSTSKKRARTSGNSTRTVCSDSPMAYETSNPEERLCEPPITADSEHDQSTSSTEDDDTPSTRLSIHEANVSRYHQEFLELSLIGRGQFGSVYKCRHRLDGCIYAIKKSLKPVAGSATERIALTEVYAHAVLGKHPHVVRYYSAWAENDHMIIQNEYCTGGSLAELLEMNAKTQTSFTELQLKQILLHIAKGLKYIHHCQLVHMDIKPGNIFISHEPHFTAQGEESTDDWFEEEFENEEPEEVVYKIGDLGHVTSVLDPQVEEGDCRYLPREILQEDFSQLQKADIFALGLTFYECATGAPLPLNGAEWHALRDGAIPALPSLSAELQMLFRAMIHPDPRERPTASQLAQQLSYCHTVKSHAQLRRELNAEKLKNEILSRQLQEAAKCLQSISPNVTSSYTAAVATGVLAGVGPASVQSRGQLLRFHDLRSGGPTTRNSNSRLIGKKVNRSVSATNF